MSGVVDALQAMRQERHTIMVRYSVLLLVGRNRP